jgi:sugar phosphate isomerase/epimerase
MERVLDFWLPIADRAGKENIWEPIAEIQLEFILSANHPHLRASFDNGHALVFSKIPSSGWIGALGPVPAHFHLHDNSREFDEHREIGKGKEDWPNLISALAQYSPEAILVAESDSFAKNRLSLNKLREI